MRVRAPCLCSRLRFDYFRLRFESFTYSGFSHPLHFVVVPTPTFTRKRFIYSAEFFSKFLLYCIFAPLSSSPRRFVFYF
jgi:hypothetical protein